MLGCQAVKVKEISGGFCLFQFNKILKMRWSYTYQKGNTKKTHIIKLGLELIQIHGVKIHTDINQHGYQSGVTGSHITRSLALSNEGIQQSPWPPTNEHTGCVKLGPQNHSHGEITEGQSQGRTFREV